MTTIERTDERRRAGHRGDDRRHRRASAAGVGRGAQVVCAAGVEGQALADRATPCRRMSHFYDTPDAYKTSSLRVDASAARRGVAGSDPEFAAKQLLVDAGVSIAVLEPMCDAQLPQAEHVLKATYNDWLADVWLGDNNWHGRWRGAISVTAQDPAPGRAGDRAVGRPPVHGRGADDAADPRNPVRQPAFRSAVRSRRAQRPSGRHAPDGPDAVRADSDLPRRQPGALARLLRVVAAAVRLASDEPGVRRRIRPASRPAGGVRRGRVHVGHAGDVAHGPDLGAPQGRSASRAAQAVGLRPRARAVHHAAAGGGQRRRCTGSTSK